MNLNRWLTARNMRRRAKRGLRGSKPNLISLLEQVPDLLGYVPASSRSQLGQDIFAWLESGCKREGYFVEVGAADGLEHSNTYLLEKEFGWSGLLAEPSLLQRDALERNRGKMGGGQKRN